MKTVTINKNSWHYKIVTYWNGYESENDDFCQYTRTVLVATAVFLLVAISLLGLALTLFIGIADTAAWLVAGLVESFVIPSFFASNIIFLTSFVAICGIPYFSVKWFKRYFNSTIKDDNSSLAVAYESWKNKVCFRIDYKD